MEESFSVIRKLKSEFVVSHRAETDIIMSVENLDVAGVVVPAILMFENYHSLWASRWDSVQYDWQDIPEFSIPGSGYIREAFVKRIASGVKFSFSDGCEPVVRWGFAADSVSIEPGT